MTNTKYPCDSNVRFQGLEPFTYNLTYVTYFLLETHIFMTVPVIRNGGAIGASITTTPVRDSDDTIDANFSAGQTLSVYQSAGTSSYPNVTAYIRWRK